MTGAQLLDAQVQEKRRYALLSELFDLTKQRLWIGTTRSRYKCCSPCGRARWPKCGRWRKT